MSNVRAIRGPDFVVVHYQGKTHHIQHPDKNVIEGIYTAAMEAKTFSDEDSFLWLEEVLNPHIKLIKAIDTGKIETDASGKMYIQGTSYRIPEILYADIRKHEENGWPIRPLLNFWMLCMSNPDEDARNRFYDYCKTYGVTITDRGYAVLYKAVTHKNKQETNRDLAVYVASEYMRIKRMKKSPNDYLVVPNEDGTYSTVKVASFNWIVQPIGGVGYLHSKVDELDTQTQFTDKHTKKSDIKLGVPQREARQECDNNIDNECSTGLHVGSFAYVKAFASRSDTILACLVNPAMIVALPRYDNSKIRTCEYFPYAVIERDDKGKWEELPSGYFEEDYSRYEVEYLQGIVDKDPEVSNIVQGRLNDLHNIYHVTDAKPA